MTSETPFQFAVRALKGDPDIRAIERCDECHGLGDVYVPGKYETVLVRVNVSFGRTAEARRPVWREEYRERCEACRGTGVSSVERYSEQQPEEPRCCYGESRMPLVASRLTRGWARKHINHGTRNGHPDFYEAAGRWTKQKPPTPRGIEG